MGLFKKLLYDPAFEKSRHNLAEDTRFAANRLIKIAFAASLLKMAKPLAALAMDPATFALFAAASAPTAKVIVALVVLGLFLKGVEFLLTRKEKEPPAVATPK